ncbi:MAG: T9SS type A sorting domain-containing protein [Ignavibacteria bacterium]|nr:T9SS type A sorting domain-containing protein [Ignavibacteria bacterium]
MNGYSYSYSEFDDILTIKYNKNGDSIWTRKFIGVGQVSDRPNAMTLDKHGNIYITGGGISCSLCPQDILTISYKNNGDLKWVKYFNGKGYGYDVGNDIIIDKNNIIYVGGSATGKGGIILEYDSIGNQLRTFSSPNFSCNKLLLDSNLNIFLGFDFYGGVTTGIDIAIAKLDPVGVLNWLRIYHNNSTNNHDYFRSMCLDNSGNVTVTGVSANAGQQGWDIATIQYSPNGDTSWINRYNTPLTVNSNDESFDIVSDKYGNVYVTGTSDSGFIARMITIKYSSTGTREWIAFYNNNNPFAWHSGARILTDTLGSIYVTGRGLGNGTGVDIISIKYSPLTNYKNFSVLIPNEFKLSQNYPNPFNPKTIINYDLPVSCEISLKVYNSSGKEIMTLVNEDKNAGSYRVEFNGSNLSSGIYFYTLFADGITISTKKLILLK